MAGGVGKFPVDNMETREGKSKLQEIYQAVKL